MNLTFLNLEGHVVIRCEIAEMLEDPDAARSGWSVTVRLSLAIRSFWSLRCGTDLAGRPGEAYDYYVRTVNLMRRG